MEPEYSRKEIIVLTVEAGETSLSTRKLLIESAGFNALSAVTAGQAVDMARKYPVHAVLFDTDVTDIPLRDFIQAVREECPKIPVYVVCSASWAPPSPDVRPLLAGSFEKMADPKKIIDEIVRAFPKASTGTLP